jgi:hypothetical protein
MGGKPSFVHVDRSSPLSTRFLVLAALIAALCGIALAFDDAGRPAHAAVTVYDLATDWSDTSNPNGPWSYNSGSAFIEGSVANWYGDASVPAQPAWAYAAAPGPDHIPLWMKGTRSAPGGLDVMAGDVLVHSWDAANGISTTPDANVTWTSPGAGTITISGNTWIASDLGRSIRWSILINGVEVTAGAIGDGDVYNRASPFDFSGGSGGANVLTGVSVVTGSVVELRMATTSNLGHFAGVNLTISFDDGSGGGGGTAYDVAGDFTIASNPNGVWSYGYTPTLGGPFSAFPNGGTSVCGTELWDGGGSDANINHNQTGADLNCIGFTWPVNIVSLHPGSAGEQAVIRFTAPNPGTYHVTAGFSTGDPGGNTLAYVLKNSDGVNPLASGLTPLASGPGQGNPGTSFDGDVTLLAGDTIDFAVDYNGSYLFDNTFLNATITFAGGGPPANCGSPHPSQVDTDGDGERNPCDQNDDNDTWQDFQDNCPLVVNDDQVDTDNDGLGDVCETAAPPMDTDGDGVPDGVDNCPLTPNANQLDTDGDGIGDACDTPQPAPRCEAKVDIMLVLDRSGSISGPDFVTEKNFASSFVQSFTFGASATQMGIVTFSTDARLDIGLTPSQPILINSINLIVPPLGSTDIAEGIDLAQSHLYVFGRPGAAHVIVVLTDGSQNEPGDPVASANSARLLGAELFAVGVGGNLNTVELQGIAGDAAHLFSSNSFLQLPNLLDALTAGICSAVPAPTPPPDIDADGILGQADHCPGIAEDFDGAYDDDGCPEPSVEVRKVLIPADDPGRFALSVTSLGGNGSNPDAGNGGTTGPIDIQVDPVSMGAFPMINVRETGAAGTDPAKYISTVACTGLPTGSGTQIEFGASTTSADYVCTITNVRVPDACLGLMPFDNVVVGTEGTDSLTGTAGKDLIYGFGGNDAIIGAEGDDCIAGGDGGDTLRGEAVPRRGVDTGNGNDVILGGDGNDQLFGYAGNDSLYGEAGSDTLDGGEGNDDLDGGNGADTLLGGSGFDDLIGGAGFDIANGGAGGLDMCVAEFEFLCELNP